MGLFSSLGNFLGNLGSFAVSNLETMGGQLAQHPEQALLGAGDPASANFWGAVTGQDYKPLVDQMGGASSQAFHDAEAKGINTKPASQMEGLAHVIAAVEAGNYAGASSGLWGSSGSAAPTGGLSGHGLLVPEGGGTSSGVFQVPSLTSGGGFGGGNSFGTGNLVSSVLGLGNSKSSGGSMGFFDSITSSVIGAGVGGLLGNAFGGSTSSVDRSSAASAADPFASQRGQYQQMLQQMMQGQFTPQDPSYAWRFGQGLQAVQRSAASQGLLNSGNFLTALTDYGQGQASAEYGNQFSRLSRLAGADIGSPSSAAQILAGQQQAQQQSFNQFGNLVGGKLGSVVSGGLGDLFGGLFSGGGGAADSSLGDIGGSALGSLF